MKIQYKNDYIVARKVTRKSNHGSPSHYTIREVICPLCRNQIGIRDFEDHVNNTHAGRRVEAFAKVQGLSFPVKCNCGSEIQMNYDKTFDKVCKVCKGVTGSTSLDEQIKFAEARVLELRKQKKQEEFENSLRSISYDDLPLIVKDKRFLFKLERDLRASIINGYKDDSIRFLNILREKLH